MAFYENPFGYVEWDILLHGSCDTFAIELIKKYPQLNLYALMETMDDGTPYEGIM